MAFVGRLIFDDSGVMGKNFKLSEKVNYNLNQTAFHLLVAYAIALDMTYFVEITGVPIFGPLAWLTADVLARLFNTDVESHIDPPAFTIALFSFILLNI